MAIYFWYSMTKPLYKPGMVRSGENLRASLDPASQSGDENFWQIEDDIQLYHYSDGTGKKVLVVHGGPGYPIPVPWTALKPLTTTYEFVYYDQRGCGKSTRPITKFSSSNYYKNMTMLERTLGIGAQIADIERIRRLLGQERLLILGHSFGAFLASMYAVEFPERVEAMILVSPANVLVMPAKHGNLFDIVKNRIPEDMKEEYARFLKRYLDFG